MIAQAMGTTRGKYRARTWLRSHLPQVIADHIPKGGRDCGNHEWYRRDERHADCYHCSVGVRALAPDERLRSDGQPTSAVSA